MNQGALPGSNFEAAAGHLERGGSPGRRQKGRKADFPMADANSEIEMHHQKVMSSPLYDRNGADLDLTGDAN